jgi:hypothetical protein
MRRPFALLMTISSLAFAGTAGLAAPAALAASSTTSAVTTAAGTSTASSAPVSPTSNFGLGNAEANATSQSTTTAASDTSSVVSTTSSGGLSGFDAVLIGVIVALVLVGISFWVWYDARSNVAQLRHGGGTTSDSMFARSHPGSKAPQRSRKPKAAERKRRKRGRAR